MTRRRRGYRPPDLTSLFDVLFIVVFAALIRAAAVQNAAAAEAAKPVEKPAPPAPPPLPADVATLRTRALAAFDTQLATRSPLVIRISAANTVEAIEVNGTRTAMDLPLLERDPNPDIALSYLGDRSVDLRLCKVAAVHLATTDLAKYLVIIAPSRAVADLPHALHDGLYRDVDRCLADQRGLATIVDPITEAHD